MTIDTIEINRLGKRLGKALGEEIGAAIAAGSNVCDEVSLLGTTSNLSAAAVAATTFTDVAVTGTYVSGAEPTGAEVNVTANAAANAALAKVKTVVDIKADNADVETLRTQVEARLDAIEAKIDELITKMKSAGQIAAS